MTSDRFDLEKAYNLFTSALKDEDDVFLDDYVQGYKEVSKFFQLLGSVFGFVSNDVRAKIEILEEFRKKDNKDMFVSIKTMLDFEKSDNLLTKSDYVSGSRTLLRLHRGLDFIYEFLENLGKLEPSDKTSTVCQSAYNNTLAKHHPWLVRKGAVVAMYALPNRENLLNRVCTDVDTAIAVLPQMLVATKDVFERTDNLYSYFNLHELP